MPCSSLAPLQGSLGYYRIPNTGYTGYTGGAGDGGEHVFLVLEQISGEPVVVVGARAATGEDTKVVEIRHDRVLVEAQFQPLDAL